MVSMVDWTRLARGGDLSIEQPQNKSLYYKQRETEAIRQAEEQGYFLVASKSFLEDTFAPDAQEEKEREIGLKKTPKDLSKVKLIHLSSSHLRTVGDIGMCRNVRICILSHNYLKRIDGLTSCEQMVKLDLSHNQISSLPGPDFWSGLKKLRILHLHDNPVGRIENLTHLSSATQLIVLTLYDTPLSLKNNYRHHVVNTIWSLKALDNHVVSDEEIIEDAEFGGYFSSRHPAFNVHLTVEPPNGASFEEHMTYTNGVIAAVNRILAFHSPVLIIQRCIRGFLTRKCYKLSTGQETWAAVTIQRNYRGWKGRPVSIPPTAAGSGGSGSGPPRTSPTFGAAPTQIVDGIKMDYDTYLQNRRPGSQSEGSTTSRTSRRSLRPEPEAVRSGSRVTMSAGKQRKNLHINLTKLQTETLQILQDDAVAIEAHLPTEASLGRAEKLEKKPKKKKEEAKCKRLKSIKQFFGPVVVTSSSPEPVNVEDEEVPIVQYRLRGFKRPVQIMDPTTELILSRREAGHDVRMAEFDYHMKQEAEPKPERKYNREPSSMRKWLSKHQSTMGLSCLRAVQQAYKDRSKMENQAMRMEYVMGMREQRETGRERVKMYADDKRGQILKERTQEQKKILEDADRRDMQRMSYLERTGERRGKSSQYWKIRRGEMTFMTDFNVQNTSVSNALMRHDRLAVQEDKQQERAEIVQAHKTVEKEQQDIVSKYLEHRQLMRQAEVAITRAALDTKMLTEANERLIAARTRVLQQKAKTAHVQATLAYPSISTPSLPPVARDSMRGLEPRPIFTTQVNRSLTVA